MELNFCTITNTLFLTMKLVRKIGNPKICLFNCFANTQEPPKEVYFFWSPCILKCFMLTFPVTSIISKNKLWLSCVKLRSNYNWPG